MKDDPGRILVTRPQRRPTGARLRFRWSDPSIPEADALALLEQLEQWSDHHELKPGQSVKVGWITCRIEEIGPSLFELTEPDFRSIPIVWQHGVNRCLRDLRRQADIVASFEPLLTPTFPDVGDAARVCETFSEGSAVIIERGQPEQRFSGWYITCDREDRQAEEHHRIEHLAPTSLYEVAIRVPGLVQFFALPPGCAGRIARGSIELYSLEGQLSVREDSYLRRLIDAERR